MLAALFHKSLLVWDELHPLKACFSPLTIAEPRWLSQRPHLCNGRSDECQPLWPIPGHVVEQDGSGRPFCLQSDLSADTWPLLPLVAALTVKMNHLTHWTHYFNINPGPSLLLHRSICFPVVPSSECFRYSSHNLLFGLPSSFRKVNFFPWIISLGTIGMKELLAMMEITH